MFEPHVNDERVMGEQASAGLEGCAGRGNSVNKGAEVRIKKKKISRE